MNQPWKRELQRAYFMVREVVFPSRCLLCGELLLFQNGKGIDICNPCFSSLSIITGKRCAICSLPLISGKETCLRCRKRSYHFNKHISLFHYGGPVKELLYYYKFKQKHSLAHLFSYFLQNIIKNMFPYLPIVPVPSRKRLMFTPGGNHLYPIIARLKKDYKKTILNCLVRKGDIPQKKLSFDQRLENLRGKITMKNKSLSGIKEILLFDDIFTTGATADECSRVLRSSGVSAIYSISLAID